MGQTMERLTITYPRALLTVPRDNGDAITILGNRRVIDPGNAERMRMAVGFRTASPES